MNVSLIELLGNLTNCVDVVETGIVPISYDNDEKTIEWHYRKWSDGTAECWGQTEASTYNFSAVSGNGYYVSESLPLPYDLFNTVIIGLTNRLQGTGSTPGNTLVTVNVNYLTTSMISYYVQSTVNNSQSLAVSLYVIGTWERLQLEPAPPEVIHS